LDQLKNELDELKSPLLHSRKPDAMQRVFAIYTAVTGREPRGTRCFQCAVDAYFELKKISTSGEGWDNSVNLNFKFNTNNKKTMATLKKYKMLVTRFRMFGSPDTITPENATDEIIDAILKINPQFSKFFQLIEKPSKNEPVLETLPEVTGYLDNVTGYPNKVTDEKKIDSSEFQAPKLEKITKKKGGRYSKKTI
jgi:hypothetical protein